VTPGKIQIAFSELQPYMEKPADHLDHIVQCQSSNTFFLNAINEGKDKFLQDYNAWSKVQKDTFNELTKNATCKSIFLSAVTQYLEKDYVNAKNFFSQVVQWLKKYTLACIDEICWYKYFNSFSNIKINTVLWMVRDLSEDLANRVVLPKDPTPCDVRLNKISLNIVEAVYYDSKRGDDDNASCGAVLASTPCSTTTNPALETQPPFFDNNGTYICQQPFPDNWADGYSVWNLAFCNAEFGDWPLYWSKLLTPMVSCYRQEKGSYIFQRAINLALHIISSTVSHNLRKEVDPSVILSTPLFEKSFGASNKKSCDGYFDKVQKADQNPQSKADRQNARDNIKSIAQEIKSSTVLASLKLFKTLIGQCSKDLAFVSKLESLADKVDFLGKAGSFFGNIKDKIKNTFGKKHKK